MKRFRFPLEAALEWREQRRAAEQARLEELSGQSRKLEDRRAAVAHDWARSQHDVLAAAEVTAQELAALSDFRRTVDQETQRLARERERMDQAIRRQQQVLLEETRRVRLLEKLKQRRLEEWLRLTERAQEREATELYLAQWGRHDES